MNESMQSFVTFCRSSSVYLRAHGVEAGAGAGAEAPASLGMGAPASLASPSGSLYDLLSLVEHFSEHESLEPSLAKSSN